MALQSVQLNYGEAKDIVCTIAGSGSIAGWSIEFKALLNPANSASVLVTKTVGAGITITDAVNRIITISFSAADTLSLEPGNVLNGNKVPTNAPIFFFVARTNPGSEGMVVPAGQLTMRWPQL